MPVFDTPEPITVTLDLSVANVLIIASDRTDSVVDLRPRDPSKAADQKAAEQCAVEFAAGTLLVKSLKTWREYTFLGPNGAVDVTIDVPSGSRLQGESTLGAIRAEGDFADCSLKASMGDIRIEHAGALRLHTSYGDVVIDSAVGDATITTSSGAVRIGRIDGGVAVKNSNGITTLGEVTGDLRAKAANGEVSIDRLHGSATITSSNGRIRIGRVTRGKVDLQTSSGEIEVGIQAGTAVWLDLSSQYGTVLNGLDAVPGPTDTDETVELTARTSYSDIVIRRAV